MASTVASPGTGYVRLLRTSRAWTFLLPGFAARQPFAMLTIGIVLLVHHAYGSYGTAGAVSAVTGVSMALAAPRGGRLADRFGQAAVLLPGVVAHAAATSALTVLALRHAPVWALVAAAVPAGASVPQISPMVRARWAALLGSGSPLLATAAAFESVTDEFTFVLGPVLATALCTAVHPAAGLIAEGALTLAGGILFAAQRRTAPPARRLRNGGAVAARDEHGERAHHTPEHREQAHHTPEHGERARPAGGPLPPARPATTRRSRGAVARRTVPVAAGVRVLAVAFLGIGTVFGGMQVSLTAFTQAVGKPGLNGPLYGLFAAGNMLAGLAFGAVGWRCSPRRRLLTAYPLLALACSTLWTAGSATLLGALGLLVGLTIAPALISGYTLVEALVPAGRRTEAFTWLTGAVGLGQAGAATVAGRLSDVWGATAGFLVPLAGTGAAALALAGLRGHLAPEAAGSPGTVTASAPGHQAAAPVD